MEDEREGGGVDRISALPDDILGKIISLLPTKDAARTQILASRWRNIWRSTPLNLDGDELPSDDDAFVSTVSHIVSTHLGPGRRFRIPPHLLRYRPDSVDNWLQSPALNGLQELDFYESRVRFQGVLPPRPLPMSALRFSATLRVATFDRCELLDSVVEALHFPQLRQLALEEVIISEASMHTLISNSPVLECLLIDQTSGVRHLRISSNSLTSIAIGDYLCSEENRLRELVIVDAPALERLLYLHNHFEMKIHVSVIATPKLETIGTLGNHASCARLDIGTTTTIQGLHVVSLPLVVPSVKVLALNPPHINLDTLIDFIKCFPSLEKLYIQSEISGDTNRWLRKHRQSFDIPIKEIVLRCYRGIQSQINFASFFVREAKKLDIMRLVVREKDNNESFINKQHDKLQMERRASPGARLEITTDRCGQPYLVHVKHVRDLSIIDPFQCRC